MSELTKENLFLSDCLIQSLLSNPNGHCQNALLKFCIAKLEDSITFEITMKTY